jgi:hypothetical protein
MLGAALPMICSCLANATDLSKDMAILRAEAFIAENGYTDSPPAQIKKVLDLESTEWANKSDEIQRQRFNTLNRHAIGIRRSRRGESDGWSIAFDYTNSSVTRENCRVVTMNPDGTSIRVEHQDGIRKFFAGFDSK